MAMDELFFLTLQEEEYKFIDGTATSLGRFSSKAMLHFSSSPRDTETAWQCSFHHMPQQPCSWSLGQFGDPKLPSSVDWNPLYRSKSRAGIQQRPYEQQIILHLRRTIAYFISCLCALKVEGMW